MSPSRRAIGIASTTRIVSVLDEAARIAVCEMGLRAAIIGERSVDTGCSVPGAID